jgi:hypothetical protein
VEDGLYQQAGVALVDAGDGLAEADGAWSARLAASRSILCSLPELGSLPPSSALMVASQSIAAVPVPWQMKPPKSSRASQVPWR